MKSGIVLSNEASKMLGWIVTASRQPPGSGPVVAYNFEFLFSNQSTVECWAYHIPTGRPEEALQVDLVLLLPAKGMERRSFISHALLASLVPMC